MSATSPAASARRRNPETFPPRRGKVKAKILGDMGKSLAAAAAKAGELLANSVRGEGGGATPPPTAYNSDSNSDTS